VCKGPVVGGPTGSKHKPLMLYLFNDLIAIGKRISAEKTKFLGSELLLHLEWNPCVSSTLDTSVSSLLALPPRLSSLIQCLVCS